MPRPGLEERLAAIQNFTQLKAMLRDDLGWPVQDMDIDDLTFEYEPEELGLKKEDAAKFEEIRQLRSIDDEPFGIFFIRFQRKHMPVTVMRRLLQQLSVRKLKSANPSDRQVWERHDLLFVSQWGEDARRHLSFVHFRDPDEEEQLPSIRVLGWDADDTDLKMEAVARQLEQNLAWRRPGEDEEAWRQRWSKAFHRRHREVIESSKTLSRELAGFARRTRSNILSLLKAETDRGPLQTLMRTFRDALIHDLDEDGFADMYAQTVAYGMLAAWLTGRSGGGTHVPVTTPFLRDLLTSFMHGGEEGGVRIDFDELGLGDIEDLFADSNREAILEDFGVRKPEEDPVIHFYEEFLHEYDSQEKKSRGVFYTPRPVVSFIVRSVDEMLRADFGLEDGLADTATWAEMAERIDELEIPDGVDPSQGFVRILDPATGTGTFLVEVIELVHRTMTEKWRSEGLLDLQIDQHWNAYVDEHLLPRLFGYELMMAPYAIAHLKIGLTLLATGYEFKGDGRVQVYLTNALEPAEADDGDWHLWSTALADESKAVNAVKRDERFTVVIGNPPYSNFGQQNRLPFILGLLRDYKEGLSERKINLDDDYIKFIRVAQHLVSASGRGVVGLITNNSYLSGVTHRVMRRSLGGSFSTIRVVDLHGSTTLRETAPDGHVDENVFDIRQGVAVALMTLAQAGHGGGSVFHGDLWGTRESKAFELTNSSLGLLAARRLSLGTPWYFFVPKDFSLADEYGSFLAIDSIFLERNTGIQTKRDNLAIQFSEAELMQVLGDLASMDERGFRSKYALPPDGRDWKYLLAQEDVGTSPIHSCVQRIVYRPFDVRWTYFTGKTRGFLAYPRRETSSHMLHDNLALVTLRINGDGHEFVAFVVSCLVEKGSLPRGNYSFFPMHLYSDSRPRSGISDLAINELRAGSRGIENDSGNSLESAEAVFRYVYAVLYSPGYRSRYSEMLKVAFPRVPRPKSRSLYTELANLGAALIDLHLLRTREFPASHCPSLVGVQRDVERVSYSNETVWIDKAKTCGFTGVPEEVWNFHIGGYQVCEKWLKDRQAKGGKNPRPGRVLTEDDIEHYQKIVAAITETIRIMGEIDEVIDAHGGWPDAFVTEPLADAETSDDEVSA